MRSLKFRVPLCYEVIGGSETVVSSNDMVYSNSQTLRGTQSPSFSLTYAEVVQAMLAFRSAWSIDDIQLRWHDHRFAAELLDCRLGLLFLCSFISSSAESIRIVHPLPAHEL